MCFIVVLRACLIRIVLLDLEPHKTYFSGPLLLLADVATVLLMIPTHFGTTLRLQMYLRIKSMAIFPGCDKGFHHLGLNEVAVELIELLEPEIEAIVINVW